MAETLAWHEDSAFWEAIDPFVTSGPDRLEAAPREVRDLHALLEIDTALRVLDLPCGAGRHTVEFAAHGHEVTGVDRTASNIERARERCDERGFAPELLVGDMREFVLEGEFDLALNLYSSIGYFEDPAQERQTALNYWRDLRPGGRLVIETVGREVLARVFRERDWIRTPEGFLLDERKVADDWTWIESTLTLIRGTKASEHRLRLRLYSAQALREMLLDVGFRKVRLFGSHAGTPYDHQAKRLVAVAEK